MSNFAVKSERLHSINQLLKAYALYERDDQYVVMDGKVKIVDENTGRNGRTSLLRWATSSY